MATEKVGIYRKYRGPIPTDETGRPLPKIEWLRKRSFSWAARWFGAEGKRYSKSFKTRKEAERFADGKRIEVQRGKQDLPQRVKLMSFMAEHERIMRGQVAYATLYDQMRALRMFAAHIGQDVELTRISPRHVESFVAFRFKSRVRVATVNKDIRTLRRVFSLAAEPRGYMPAGQNPFAKIRERKVTFKPVRYVKVEDLLVLLDRAQNTWWKALITLAYISGGRRDELLNLTWADVDFARGSVCFSPKEASEQLLAWEPKDHEVGVIPVPELAVQVLADLQNEVEEGSPHVFICEKRLAHIPSRRKKNAWDDRCDLVNNLIRDLQVMCARACIESFTLHDLHRSCITNWAQVLPIHVVQRLAGHSDITTTQRYYLAVRESDMERARQFQSEILATDLTDPKLTHSAPKRPFSKGAPQNESL